MTKTVVGFMLVDAPHSALNCAGLDVGERTENIVKVKAIRKGRFLYPYVSGQALRFGGGNLLRRNLDGNIHQLLEKRR